MADLLSSISVFLVFLVYLFGAVGSAANQKLNSEMPSAKQTENRRRFASDVLGSIYQTLAATVAFFVTFYVLLPRTIDIIATSNFNAWKFDELKTLFVFIEIGILVFSIVTGWKAFKLFRRWMKLKSTTNLES